MLLESFHSKPNKRFYLNIYRWLTYASLHLLLQINWDAAAVPFDMPFDFFNTVAPRGAIFNTKDKEFRVSNSANPADTHDDRFDSILPKAVSNQFQRFSPERLFTPLKSNKMAVTFRIPSTNKRARTTGFGAVFVDVDRPHATHMRYFDKNGCLIARIAVPPRNEGLSFVGIVVLNAHRSVRIPAISKVRINLGTISVQHFAHLWRGSHGIGDVCVLDDLIYGEPRM